MPSRRTPPPPRPAPHRLSKPLRASSASRRLPRALPHSFLDRLRSIPYFFYYCPTRVHNGFFSGTVKSRPSARSISAHSIVCLVKKKSLKSKNGQRDVSPWQLANSTSTNSNDKKSRGKKKHKNDQKDVNSCQPAHSTSTHSNARPTRNKNDDKKNRNGEKDGERVDASVIFSVSSSVAFLKCPVILRGKRACYSRMTDLDYRAEGAQRRPAAGLNDRKGG